MNLAIRQTRDGSHTLFDLDINKTYHSVHGALNESQHVFINAGLEAILKRQSRVKLLEIGLGTGLNALLTIQTVVNRYAAHQPCEVHYTGLEPYPIPMEMVRQLNYAGYFETPVLYQSLLEHVHQVAWEQPQTIVTGFYLTKINTTLESFDSHSVAFDLIYFDPFPPSAQPYLWEKPVLAKITQLLVPGGILTTYCAKGQFKRNLKELGMKIESLPGPPGKREMTRAVKRV